MLPFSTQGRNLEVTGYEKLHVLAYLSFLRFRLKGDFVLA